MALSKYIRDLLFRYECVIIPDFGGFLTKTISAQIDERTHTLYPPSKRLGFNSQLTESDGLLANHIASVDKVPYETAVNFIKLEVEKLKTKLINEDITLEEVGTFSLNSEYKLLFEPDPNANFLTDSFGLAKVVAPSVFREDYMNQEVIFDSISDVLSEEEIYINTDKIHRGFAPFMRYAAIFVVLLAIGYFLGKQIINNNELSKQVSELEESEDAKIDRRIQEATFEINKALPNITIQVNKGVNSVSGNTNEENLDEVNEKQESAIVPENTEAAEEKPVENKELTSISNTANSDKKYHIVAGAFREPSNAAKKLKQLKAKGYDAHIVGKNKWQLTQVAFGSYTTKEEAQSVLNEIRQSVAKDAWLLKK